MSAVFITFPLFGALDVWDPYSVFAMLVIHGGVASRIHWSPPSLLALLQPGHRGVTPLHPELHVSPHKAWGSARGPPPLLQFLPSVNLGRAGEVVKGLAGWAGG